jgi:phage regulator Rha-like protein
MVANKMTGEKGVLFTAAYVIKFEEMEKTLKINPNRSSYRDLASLMREWRLWAKEMKMPANQAMKLLI